MAADWTPLGMDTEIYSVLHEGIPPWMKYPLSRWMSGTESTLASRMQGRDSNVVMASEYDRLTRENYPFAPHVARGRGLWDEVEQRDSPEDTLRLADYFLLKLTDVEGTELPTYLENLLVSSGSAWAVGKRGRFHALQRRVPQGVQIAVEAIIARTGSAGALLGESWYAAFGRTPDPEEAYEKAIKAVEEAAVPAVSPRNTKATLGTILRDMEAQGGWTIPLSSDASAAGANGPLALAKLLWTSQASRHGGNDYRKPSQDEAEAAVLIAVPLVQWFASGLLTRHS